MRLRVNEYKFAVASRFELARLPTRKLVAEDLAQSLYFYNSMATGSLLQAGQGRAHQHNNRHDELLATILFYLILFQ